MKTISMELSASSIDNAIRQLNDYKISLEEKCRKVTTTLAEWIQGMSQMGFDDSDIGADLGSHWEFRKANVVVRIEGDGNRVTVVADGTDAVWVEFGSGVYFNGHLGGSPNPLGRSIGLTIGSYGKGRGSQDKWEFYDGTGDSISTHGTFATMPMYHAVENALDDLVLLAKGVFAND